MEWYKLKQDWESYYAVVIEKVESGDYINKPENFGNRVTLNEYAYEIFEHSMDRSKLEKALSWMDVVVENITDSTDYASNMYDTKANLLYKLKRKTEAIALEARAVKVAPNNKDLQKVYQKMQIGDPTW
jgi:tetratricopeptide (TPR) repeat protein